MPEGLMLVNVLPAFGLNEVNITTPLLRMKKNLKNHEKNLQLTKKYLPLQSQKKKHSSLAKFFEVYFCRIQGVLTMKEGVTSW